jgi:hypothetical protein
MQIDMVLLFGLGCATLRDATVDPCFEADQSGKPHYLG